MRRSTIALFTLLCAFAASAAQAAPSAISNLTAVASGGSTTVSGIATFGGENPVTVGTDSPSDNAAGPAGAAIGLDVSALQISQPDPAKADLLFTIKLAGMTGGGIPETVLYNWDIEVDGGASSGGANYSLKTMRSRASSTLNTNPWSSINTCVPGATGFTCTVKQTVASVYDATASEIRMTIPIAAIDAKPGSTIAAWPRATNPFWIGPSASGAQTLTNIFDTATHDDYKVPTRAVTVGAWNAAGTPPLTTNATVGGNGAFSAVAPGGAAGGTAAARACFGTNCTTLTVPIS